MSEYISFGLWLHYRWIHQVLTNSTLLLRFYYQLISLVISITPESFVELKVFSLNASSYSVHCSIFNVANNLEEAYRRYLYVRNMMIQLFCPYFQSVCQAYFLFLTIIVLWCGYVASLAVTFVSQDWLSLGSMHS